MCTFILQSYTIEMNITVRNETHSVRYETIIKTPVIAHTVQAIAGEKLSTLT